MPANSGATLTSLPDHLLTALSLNLDTSSAVSLSTTSRACKIPAERQMYRDIDLVTGFEAPARPARGQGVVVEDAQIVKLEEHMRKILRAMEMDDRRWAMIRTVRMLSKPGMVRGMGPLLQGASRTLVSLTMQPPRNLMGLPTRQSETLDMAIRAHGLHFAFPALQHLTLASLAIYDVSFLPSLLRSAPNLTSLDLTYSDRTIRGPSTESFPQCTKLEVIRVRYSAAQEPNPALKSLTPFASLLGACPFLRQLVINYTPYAVEQVTPVLDAIGRLGNLVDLSWEQYGDSTLGEATASGEEYRMTGGKVRRLAVTVRKQDLPLPSNLISDFPSLETIYLDYATSNWPSRFPPFYGTTAMQLLDAGFASWLRRNPCLRNICCRRDIEWDDLTMFDDIDDLEATGEHVTGHVRSIRHGGEEVLRVRLLMQDTEDPKDVLGDGWKRVLYVGCRDYDHEDEESQNDDMEDEDEDKVIGRDDPVWQEFSDYGGELVPFKVLERMRVVEGLSEEEWDKRGVEVGDKAWAVLMRWKDGRSK